jgi:hypothetical protein
MQTLVMVIIVLVVLGIILYAINNFLPIDAKLKQLINIITVAAVVIWLIYKYLLPLIPN